MHELRFNFKEKKEFDWKEYARRLIPILNHLNSNGLGPDLQGGFLLNNDKVKHIRPLKKDAARIKMESGNTILTCPADLFWKTIERIEKRQKIALFK